MEYYYDAYGSQDNDGTAHATLIVYRRIEGDRVEEVESVHVGGNTHDGSYEEERRQAFAALEARYGQLSLLPPASVERAGTFLFF